MLTADDVCFAETQNGERRKGDSNPTAQAAAAGDALSASWAAVLCAQSPPTAGGRRSLCVCRPSGLCTQRWYRFARTDRHTEKGLMCQCSQFNDVVAKVLQHPRPQEEQPALPGFSDLSLGERQRARSVECRSGHCSPGMAGACGLRLVRCHLCSLQASSWTHESWCVQRAWEGHRRACAAFWGVCDTPGLLHALGFPARAWDSRAHRSSPSSACGMPSSLPGTCKGTWYLPHRTDAFYLFSFTVKFSF